MTQFKDPIFYTPATLGRVPSTIDMAVLVNGEYVGRFSGETLVQLAKRYPGAAIGELDDVVAEKEAMQTSQPVEIKENQFSDMLECLPPVGWQDTGDCSSFKMCEHLSGRITGVYAKVGSRYFNFNDLYTITHAQIMTKVKASVAFSSVVVAQ